MGDTKIEWCDKVWNPVRGCSRVSPGCENCYAEKVAARFCGPGLPYEGLARIGKNGARWTGTVRVVPEHLADPLRWKKPRRIFVNSMSDLFHEKLSNEEIAAVFGVMAASPRHTFQVLTKRAERMGEWFAWAAQVAPTATCVVAAAAHLWPDDRDGRMKFVHGASTGRSNWPLPNVWLGVSVEDQRRADERIPLLLETPAAVRFISAEPLLGPIKGCTSWRHRDLAEYPSKPDRKLDWVIIGSESGPGARPMATEWAAWIVDDCAADGVAVFTKQIATPSHPKGGDPAFWPSGIWPREFP